MVVAAVRLPVSPRTWSAHSDRSMALSRTGNLSDRSTALSRTGPPQSMHESCIQCGITYPLPEIKALSNVELALEKDAKAQMNKYGSHQPTAVSARFNVSLPQIPQHCKYSRNSPRSCAPVYLKQQECVQAPVSVAVAGVFNKHTLVTWFQDISRCAGVVTHRELLVALRSRPESQAFFQTFDDMQKAKTILKELDPDSAGLDWTGFAEFFRKFGLLIDYHTDQAPLNDLHKLLSSTHEEWQSQRIAKLSAQGVPENVAGEIRQHLSKGSEARFRQRRCNSFSPTLGTEAPAQPAPVRMSLDGDAGTPKGRPFIHSLSSADEELPGNLGSPNGTQSTTWTSIDSAATTQLSDASYDANRLLTDRSQDASPTPTTSKKSIDAKFNMKTLQAWFRDIDRDGSGVITQRELVVALTRRKDLLLMLTHISDTERAEHLDLKSTDGEARAQAVKHMKIILEEVDTDGSGSMEWPEFVDFFRRANLLLEYKTMPEKNRVTLCSALGTGLSEDSVKSFERNAQCHLARTAEEEYEDSEESRRNTLELA